MNIIKLLKRVFMKYENNTSTSRNQTIIAYRNAHLDMPLRTVGAHFAISKQRVHQILKRGH